MTVSLPVSLFLTSEMFSFQLHTCRAFLLGIEFSLVIIYLVF